MASEQIETGEAEGEREDITEAMTIDDDDNSLDSLTDVALVHLTEEQDKILRQVAATMMQEGLYGDTWYDSAEAWKTIKTSHPGVFDEYSMGELRRAYFNLSPSLWDLLTKTPIGPMVFVNVGFMIRDWDFYQELFGFSTAAAN